MTSSCGHSWLGPRRGPLQLVMVYLGPWPANLAGSILGHLLSESIFLQKRHFWSRIDHYPRFFGLFLTSDEPDSCKAAPSLEKPGSRSILVAGKSLHVIESTSFSSPTGPQRPKTSPPDPPGGPPGGFENIFVIFF